MSNEIIYFKVIYRKISHRVRNCVSDHKTTATQGELLFESAGAL